MPEKKNDKTPKLHPIQLISLNVSELYIKITKPFALDEGLTLGSEDFSIRTGHKDYDEKDHTIEIAIKIEIGGEEGQKSPFTMRVVLGGLFQVDETRFPKVHIMDWAKRNAPIILYPYLREQVFALTVRCGYPGLILPLLEVPTIKVEVPKKMKKVKAKPAK